MNSEFGKIYISLENTAFLFRCGIMGKHSNLMRKRILPSKSCKSRREREFILKNLEIQEEKENLVSNS